jgi:hypothetical protein
MLLTPSHEYPRKQNITVLYSLTLFNQNIFKTWEKKRGFFFDQLIFSPLKSVFLPQANAVSWLDSNPAPCAAKAMALMIGKKHRIKPIKAFFWKKDLLGYPRLHLFLNFYPPSYWIMTTSRIKSYKILQYACNLLFQAGVKKIHLVCLALTAEQQEGLALQTIDRPDQKQKQDHIHQ